MEKFSLSDRYRLELHWGSITYEEGFCEFNRAYFSGPALQEALKLNYEDHIMLDFFSQYLILVTSPYVGKFSWQGPNYRADGTILFDKAVMIHEDELNKVPKLNSNDYLVIDTKGHEVEEHPYNLVYKTYVVNEDTQLYNFGGK
jgi:hypothetical protein